MTTLNRLGQRNYSTKLDENRTVIKQHDKWYHTNNESLTKLSTEEIQRHYKDMNEDSADGSSSLGEGESNLVSKVKFHLNHTRERMLSVFLPKNYPVAVSDNYIDYCKWQALQYIAGSFSGVLSMQALLYAAGITSQMADSGNGFALAVIGGALAWVIKDGLGQLGGILFASKVNTNFDADPKFWRMSGEYALIASALLEVTTAISGPSWFIVQASIANIGKNVSCFAASATRAAMNQSFAKSDNLADVTAKATSQALACSLIGTALGIVYSSVTALAQFSFVKVFPVFCILSAIQLFSLYKAVSKVRLKVLNKQRFFIVCSQYITNGDILTPAQVSGMEKYVFPFFEEFQRIKINSKIEDLISVLGKGWQEELATNGYILVRLDNNVHIVFAQQANTDQVFRAMYQATCILCGKEVSGDKLEEQVTLFISNISAKGWAVDHDFVEDNSHMRLAIE